MTGNFKRLHIYGADKAYQMFFEALKADDIDALVEAAWNFFGLPVLLTDENYKLICQYPKRRIGQQIWDTLFTEQVLPLATIQEYQQTYLNNIDGQYYKPFYSQQGPAADCPRIFGEVHSDARIYGHIAVFMFDNSLQPEDLHAAQIFIDALEMLLTPRKNRQNTTLSSYLYDLLNEDTAPQIKTLALRSLAANIPGPFSLMVTPVGTTASQRAFAAMAISHMPLTYRAMVNTIYQDCIVTLFGLMQGGHYSEKEIGFFKRVSDYLSPANSSSGISQPFADLSELKGRFQQAFMTAHLTQKPCEFFDFIFPAPMFEAIGYHVNTDMFIHPVLKTMLQYDERNQTEYFRTLQVYSLSLHNKESAARILCIHRNTLLYRLNRISEIFKLPYEEPTTALALLNSFQLYGISYQRQTDFGLSPQE